MHGETVKKKTAFLFVRVFNLLKFIRRVLLSAYLKFLVSHGTGVMLSLLQLGSSKDIWWYTFQNCSSYCCIL